MAKAKKKAGAKTGKVKTKKKKVSGKPTTEPMDFDAKGFEEAAHTDAPAPIEEGAHAPGVEEGETIVTDDPPSDDPERESQP